MSAAVASKIDAMLGDLLSVWIWTGCDLKMLLRSAYFQGVVDTLDCANGPETHYESHGRNTIL